MAAYDIQAISNAEVVAGRVSWLYHVDLLVK